ncbi:MAG TPA: hypothetical protein VKE51_05690 [Vicinamibacterales bacterium]|nr:hypothetical protein [Vicinamibacterales bacterium]
MRMMLLSVHIVAASLGIVTGFVALYAAKGARRHRRSGMLFVYAMVTMAILGAAIAGVWRVSPATNIPVGLLTAYLVITALTAVLPRDPGSRSLDVGLMLVAAGVSVFMLTFGVEVLNGGGRPGMRAFPFFMFGTIALLASAGDLRMIRTGVLTGAPRIARHLWRMSLALLIASLSFSVQLPKYLPKSLRIPSLLAVPLLAVFVTMLYWLWRVRFRRSVRGLVVPTRRGALATEAA